MFKLLRILILLFVLASVYSTYLIQQNIVSDWNGFITIKIVPVNVDGSRATQRYIDTLDIKDFEEVERYLIKSAESYGVDINNGMSIELEPALSSPPPPLPKLDSGFISTSFWSLRMRFWAWRNQAADHESSFIRLYMLYQSPASATRLPHSTGLRKGLLGLINVRAKNSAKRFHNVVLTHELLHIFGAQDKYDLSTGTPLYPQGYLNPQRSSQAYAEIMARAKPLEGGRFEVAKTLSQVRIGRKTADEIGWPK